MIGRRFGLIAAMAVAGLAAVPYPSAHTNTRPRDQPESPTPEKVSRQRRRWLERQARKAERRHRK